MGATSPEKTEACKEVSAESFARLLRMFWQPREVFSEVARKPTFLWVLSGIALVSLSVQLVLVPRIDLEATILQGTAQAGRSLSEEQLREAVGVARKFQYFGVVTAPLGTLAVTALLGGLYFLGLKLAGSEAAYPSVLAAVAHASLPPSLVQSSLLAIVASTRSSFAAQEIPRLLKSHLGAFLPEAAPRALVAFGEVLDVFNVWYWVLLSWGLASVGGVSVRLSATLVAVVWGVWTVFRVFLALVR